MTTSGYTKPHAPAGETQTTDSFQNFQARVGIGTDNLNSASRYGFNPVTRNRVQLEYAYRGSWVAGMAVDTVAKDMTREGVEIQSEDKPDKIEQLQKEAERLQIWPKLCDTIKWARLYGGAVGFLMIDGQQPDTPLRLETIGKGQFKGILPLDRWMLQPDLQRLVKEYGPEFGQPEFCNVLPDVAGTPFMRIHHSRLIRLIGVELPYWQKISENLWGQSVLERLWDRMIPFDSATEGMAQLVYKAHLRTIKVEGLRQIIATGGAALDGLVKQIEMMRRFQSNEGITLLDAKDDFDTHQYTFSGLSDVLLQLGQQISGALGIPLVRLFGQSPAGLNSTGESDLRTYYDGIKQEQEQYLRPGVEKVYHALYRSTFGDAPPKSFTLIFAPLWQMSEEQRAVVTNQVTAAVMAAYEGQVIDRATALKELRALAQITGAFSNITDKQIKEAESEEPPAPGRRGEAENADPGSEAEGGPGARADKDEPGGKDLRAAA